MQRHPLEYASLAPFGTTTHLMQQRLKYNGDGNPTYVNPEIVIARMWARRNRARAGRSLPVRHIVHDLLPKIGKRYRLTSGDFFFRGQWYLTRDIVVMSSVVQWFGTNVGGAFLTEKPRRKCSPEREFLVKAADFTNGKFYGPPDIVTFWCHDCTPRCYEPPIMYGEPHLYDPSTVSSRDRAIAQALLQWLGREDGREFIRDYLQTLRRIRDRVHREYDRKLTMSKAA